MLKWMVSGIMFALLLMNVLTLALNIDMTIPQVNAQVPAILAVDPPTYTAPGIGHIFKLNVTITNVTNLFGYEVKIWYNSTFLDCLSVELPLNHFLTPTDPTRIFIVKRDVDDTYNYDDTIGRVIVAMSLLAPEQAKNGSGVLFTMTFNVTSSGGPAPIKIWNPCVDSPYPSKLVYVNDIHSLIPQTGIIPHIAIDGEVTAGNASVPTTPITPNYNQDIVVSATINWGVGIDQAFLSYTFEGEWHNVSMTQYGGMFTAIIPSQPYGTIVQYRIYANDTLGNWGVSEIYSYKVTVSDLSLQRIQIVYLRPKQPSSNNTTEIPQVIEPQGQMFYFINYLAQWRNKTIMYYDENGLWKATIPQQLHDVMVILYILLPALVFALLALVIARKKISKKVSFPSKN